MGGANCEAKYLLLLCDKMRVGQRVSVNYGYKGKWYPATVKDLNYKKQGSLGLGVEYDDNPGRINGTPLDTIRIKSKIVGDYFRPTSRRRLGHLNHANFHNQN